MAADDDASFEPEQKVLTDRLDRLQHSSVDADRDPRCLAARVRRLDLEPLPDERLQAARGAMERVALGHVVQLRVSVRSGGQATRGIADLLAYMAASAAARRPSASRESTG